MSFYKMIRVIVLLFFPVFLATGAAYAGVNDMLIAKLQTRDPDMHIDKLDLSATKDERLISALGSIAADFKEEWHVRIAAIKVLGDTADPSATDALLYAVRDFCPAIRWNAATALGRFRDDTRVTDALIESLSSETLFVTEAAIRSLGEIGSRRAVPLLIERLSSGSFAIRSSAIQSLGKIGDRRAVPYLDRIAEKDADMLIRDEAVSALDAIEAKGKNY